MYPRHAAAALAALSLAATGLGGCATAVRGTNADMRIETVPPGATVTTDLPARGRLFASTRPEGRGCAPTPCKFEVPRKADFLLRIEAENHDPVEIGVISRNGKERLDVDMSNRKGGRVGDTLEVVGVNSLAVPVTAGLLAGAGASSASSAALGAIYGAMGGGVFAVAGMGVDAVSGAMLSPNPNPIRVVLPPEGADLPPHVSVERLRVWRMKGREGREARKAWKRMEKRARKAARAGMSLEELGAAQVEAAREALAERSRKLESLRGEWERDCQPRPRRASKAQACDWLKGRIRKLEAKTSPS